MEVGFRVNGSATFREFETLSFGGDYRHKVLHPLGSLRLHGWVSLDGVAGGIIFRLTLIYTLDRSRHSVVMIKLS